MITMQTVEVRKPDLQKAERVLQILKSLQIEEVKSILKYISDNPGTNQKQMGKDLGIENPTINRHLNPFIEEGYVKRKNQAGDARWLEYYLNIDKFIYLNKKIKSI